MTCTFFGHRTATEKIVPVLQSTIIDLIENHNVDVFFVGNHGSFDSIVKGTLKKLSESYYIKYYVVLAYYPEKADQFDKEAYSDTIVFEGFENVPKRFAISYRNKWMISKSDYVVTYVTHDIGSGAAQFKTLAERKGKTVINLPDLLWNKTEKAYAYILYVHFTFLGCNKLWRLNSIYQKF